MVAARLDADEKDAIGFADAIGREQPTTIISEAGLYKVTQSSRKSVFRAFWRWATHIAEACRTASRLHGNGADRAVGRKGRTQDDSAHDSKGREGVFWWSFTR
jgi:prophage antirepressor-like protein